jgi:hypothetical protein
MTEPEMQACLDKLEAFSDQIGELTIFIGEKNVRRSPAKDVARTMMRELKERLASEDRRMSTVRGAAALSEVERAYYAPAVSEACAEISVRWTSVPGEAWMAELMGARIDIDTLAGELRRELEG